MPFEPIQRRCYPLCRCPVSFASLNDKARMSEALKLVPLYMWDGRYRSTLEGRSRYICLTLREQIAPRYPQLHRGADLAASLVQNLLTASGGGDTLESYARRVLNMDLANMYGVDAFMQDQRAAWALHLAQVVEGSREPDPLSDYYWSHP